MTVAFEIKYPWWKHKPWPKKHRHAIDRSFEWKHRIPDEMKKGRESMWDTGYRETFITIWHVDPEKGGSDDSCGWFYPRLTNWQKERLWNGAWGESRNPHFLACGGREWEGTYTEAVSLYAGMIALVVRLLDLKVSFEKIQRMAVERIHISDCCRPENVFCFEPGYHTNSTTDSQRDRQDHFYGILCGIARCLLDDLRPWWKHPKWHVWHWKLQIHPLQNFIRRHWTKCCKCGKRGFKKGAMSDWNGTRIWHDECDDSAKPAPTTIC